MDPFLPLPGLTSKNFFYKRGMTESVSCHFHEGMVEIIFLFLIPAILPWAAWPIRGNCVPHENGGNLSLSPWKNGWNYFVDCLA